MNCRPAAVSPNCSSAIISGSCALAREVLVVKDGKIVEARSTAHVRTAERPYTRALMAAFDLAAISP